MAQVLIPGGTGTLVGNMTGLGGLAAAFDGVTNQGFAASCYSTGNAPSGYVGKQWSAAKTITACTIYAPSDRNFASGTGSDASTILLRGSNNGSAWTTLATIGPTSYSPGAGPIAFSGITVSAAYTYHSVADNGGGTFVIIAEVLFYETVASSPHFSRPLRFFTRRF